MVVSDDLAINLFSAGGLLCLLIGIVVFTRSVGQISCDMSVEVRRDVNLVNLVFLLGIVVKASGVFESNPLGFVWCYLAALVPFCWASMRFAQGKGLSKAFGVLGMLGFIEMMVLLLLPTRIARDPEATG